MNVPRIPRRRKTTLGDVWFANIAASDKAGNPAPPVRQPNTPRSMPARTGPLHPVRQSAN